MTSTDTSKVCAMCRKSVDLGAVICAHCSCSTNYQYFKEIPYDEVARERHETRVNFAAIIASIFTVIAVILGIALFGFWIGLGIGVITFKIISVVTNLGSSLRGLDKISIACGGCSQTNTYQWPADSLDPGKTAFFDCLVCKHRTQVMSGPPIFSPVDPPQQLSCPPGSTPPITPDIVWDSLDH